MPHRDPSNGSFGPILLFPSQRVDKPGEDSRNIQIMLLDMFSVHIGEGRPPESFPYNMSNYLPKKMDLFLGGRE